MEMNQIGYPFEGPALPSVVVVPEDELFTGDVLIFCASRGIPPVEPGSKADVRMAQLDANRDIIRHYAGLARNARYQGLVCVVSDPVDNLCAAFLNESGLEPWQIQGYGLGVMHKRAEYYASKDSRFASYLTEGRAFGPHGKDLVIANSIDRYDDALSRELTEQAVRANIAVRDLGFKPYIAPAFPLPHCPSFSHSEVNGITAPCTWYLGAGCISGNEKPPYERRLGMGGFGPSGRALRKDSKRL